MARIEQEGLFKCVPLQWGLQEVETKDGGTFLKGRFELGIFAHYEKGKGEWVETWPVDSDGIPEWTAPCDLVLIKKDGTVNEKLVKDLKEATGWDGDPSAFNSHPFGDCEVQTTVKAEIGTDGVTRYKAGWINPVGSRAPGSIATNPEDLNSIAAKYGSALKSIPAAATPVVKREKPIVVTGVVIPAAELKAASDGGVHDDMPF